MNRYYQMGDYSDWIMAKETDQNDPWSFCEQHQAARVTILTLSGDPDIMGGFEQIQHRGLLIFDIDSTDIMEAHKSVIELCNKLMSMGVDERDLEIHLSGSKGFHIYVNPDVFIGPDALKTKKPVNIPDTYKRLAMSMYVPHLDMGVYSGSKGTMVRPPNALRPDGKYKVRLLYSELLGLTLEQYHFMTSSPRNIPHFKGINKFAEALGALFVAMVKLKHEAVPARATGYDDLSVFKSTIPACIEALASGKRAQDANLNQIGLNLGCWSARANQPQAVLDSLYERVVTSNPSDSGKSSYSRKMKLKGMHSYVASDTSKYKFHCGAMKKLLTVNPCKGCPIKDNVENKAIESLISQQFVATRNGQYFEDEKSDQMVASFTMNRVSVTLDESTKTILSSVMELTIPNQGTQHKIEVFLESAWQSKPAFKKAISGIDGAMFLGSDNTVARIRQTIARDQLMNEGELVVIYRTNKIGLLYNKIGGSDNPFEDSHRGRFTYVEPGYSVNSGGVPGSHTLVGHQQAVPKLKSKQWNEPVGSKANKAFSLLLRCNSPETISAVLGWWLLAHLKTHVYQAKGCGILLNITGIAGTGKNNLVSIMQRLSGLEGEAARHTVSAPNSTKLPIQLAVTTSTTIPRIINEFNPKSLMNGTRYQDIIEIMKDAYDSQSVTRGKVGGGDPTGEGANVSATSDKITAPVVAISEEPIVIPAVLQRSVRVNITPKGRDFGSKAFWELEPLADHLTDFARVLILEAMQTSVKDVAKRIEETVLPKSMDKLNDNLRLRLGYQTILMAYKWAEEVLSKEKWGVSEENLKGLSEMRENFMTVIQDSASRISVEANVTEVDKVISDILVMTHNDGQSIRPMWVLQPGIHYAVDNETLYLDMLIIYPKLMAYKRMDTVPLAIKSFDSFMVVVKSSPYYLTDKGFTDMILSSQGRPMLALDMNLMEEANLPVALIKG